MKLKEIPKEELELMGYDDIAWYVLQESGKKMKLADIFKKVIKTLELPEEYIENHLVDFFEQMSINKKFIMLKNGFWDLQSRHKSDIILEDTEEDDYIDDAIKDIEDQDLEEIDEENEDDIFYEKDEDDEELDDDELADLVIIDGEEDNAL